MRKRGIEAVARSSFARSQETQLVSVNPLDRLRAWFTFSRQEAIAGILFALPWMVGFIAFTIGPMVASVLFSFTKWELVTPPQWVGLANFRKIFLEDKLFRIALKVSTLYAVGAVPLSLIFGMLLALLLNQDIRGVGFVRTAYYLPSQISGVAVALLWGWLLSTEYGLVNYFLGFVGIKPIAWLQDPPMVIPSFWLISLWGVGGGMLVYLAGLQGIPTELYDAAKVDGASAFRRFWHVTIPMMTPVIFFNLIMGIIRSLQVFAVPFVMTQGGPHYASLFYILYLYMNGFRMFHMGYASALAWILFFYIMALTALVLRSSRAWVYYAGSLKGR